MSKEFWDQRWAEAQTGWDIGSVSTPLKTYIDQLTDKTTRILVPGCGNAYEAEYLFKNGFENTFIVEISELAINSFLKRYPDFPKAYIFNCDFFDLVGEFELIIEQTFFCAIDPILREKYVLKMNELLVKKGKLVGLFFEFPLETGPPYGGAREEYEQLFAPYFNLLTLEDAHNSIQPRLGRELFFRFEKK